MITHTSYKHAGSHAWLPDPLIISILPMTGQQPCSVIASCQADWRSSSQGSPGPVRQVPAQRGCAFGRRGRVRGGPSIGWLTVAQACQPACSGPSQGRSSRSCSPAEAIQVNALLVVLISPLPSGKAHQQVRASLHSGHHMCKEPTELYLKSHPCIYQGVSGDRLRAGDHGDGSC